MKFLPHKPLNSTLLSSSFSCTGWMTAIGIMFNLYLCFKFFKPVYYFLFPFLGGGLKRIMCTPPTSLVPNPTLPPSVLNPTLPLPGFHIKLPPPGRLPFYSHTTTQNFFFILYTPRFEHPISGFVVHLDLHQMKVKQALQISSYLLA